MDLSTAFSEISHFWLPVILFLVSLLITLFMRTIFYRITTKWAANTETPIDDLIINSTRLASILWCLIFALYLSMNFAYLPVNILDSLRQIFVVLLFLSVTIVIAEILVKLIGFYIHKFAVDLPVTELTFTLTRIIILSLGLLIVLSYLGIPIMPLVTALGIGGLAVALALQDSLANFFSGIHLLIEQAILIGDYIELNSGEKGYVLDIGWRTTKIRQIHNNVIIIPNKKLAESIITNFNLHEKRFLVRIEVSAGYESTPAYVERILLEITSEAMGKVPGLLADPPPTVRFAPGFGEFSLDFTLFVNVNEVTDKYFVQHELRKRIFTRFREVGIEIPFPRRTIYIAKNH